MKFENILVAYDGSETSKAALARAKEFAKQHEETNLIIVSVLEFSPNMYEIIDKVSETYLKYAEDELMKAQETVKDLPNKVETVILQGHPASCLIDYAGAHGVDLILIGSRGLNGLQRLFLGSVSFHVVQKAPCDVLVIKAEDKEKEEAS